jgi:hypothetical protein
MFCFGVCTYDKERTQAKDKADLLGAHAKVGLQVHRRWFEVHRFSYYYPFLNFPSTFPAFKISSLVFLYKKYKKKLIQFRGVRKASQACCAS